MIKSKKLRSIGSVSASLYVQLYKKYDKNKLDSLKKQVLVIEQYNMYNSNNTYYKSLLADSVFSGAFIKNKKLVLNKIKTYVETNYDNLLSNQVFNNYLSEFPKLSSSTISDLKLSKIYANVFSKVYIYELPQIYLTLKKKADNYHNAYVSYEAPYDNFLSLFLLPDVNIWIDKFSWKINPDIFGSNYLSKAAYIDLNVIKFWTKFFTYSYIWKLYQWLKNNILSIKYAWDKVDSKKWLLDTHLSMQFGLYSDKSFYWLISKLTLTSNVKSVMLLNEFTYDLWNEIKSRLIYKLALVNAKDKKLSLWEKLMLLNLYNCTYWNDSISNLLWVNISKTDLQNLLVDYKKDFFKRWNLQKIFDILNSTYWSDKDWLKSSFYKFVKNNYQNINNINVLIWARLYDCIKNKWYCSDIFDKQYTQISNAIKVFANCDIHSPIDNICKFKFLSKFDSNYFIAYTMVDKLWQIDYSLIDRLRDVYNNLAGIISLWKFTFVKNQSNAATNSNAWKYFASVDIDIYNKYLTKDSYNKILSYIWSNSCKSVTNWSTWSLSVAYKYLSNRYNQIYKLNLWATEIYNLKKLMWIVSEKQKNLKKETLLDNLLDNLQVYRIFKERGYCN